MAIHIFVFLLLLWSSTSVASTEDRLLGAFAGTWEQVAAGDPSIVVDSGAISLYVLDQKDRTLTGTIRLSNTPRCKDLIAFRGTIQEKDARLILIESEGSPVCGYSGKLEMKLVRIDGQLLKGSYAYRYLGGVWMEGTFTIRRLSPAPPK